MSRQRAPARHVAGWSAGDTGRKLIPKEYQRLVGKFGEPTIAVDTHIFRVSNRTGIAKGKTPLEVEKRLVRLTPDEFKKDAHHWLILHGRYVCKARTPLCGECAIVEWCEFKKKVFA